MVEMRGGLGTMEKHLQEMVIWYVMQDISGLIFLTLPSKGNNYIGSASTRWQDSCSHKSQL